MNFLVNRKLVWVMSVFLVFGMLFVFFTLWLFSIKFLAFVPVENSVVFSERVGSLGVLMSKFTARFLYVYEEDGGLYGRFVYLDGTGVPRWIDGFLGGNWGGNDYMLTKIYIGFEGDKNEFGPLFEPTKYTKKIKLPIKQFEVVSLNYIYQAKVETLDFNKNLVFCNNSIAINNFCRNSYLVTKNIDAGIRYEDFYKSKGAKHVRPIIISSIGVGKRK